MQTRIYFRALPDGEQPHLDVDEPFEAVVEKFSPELVETEGYGWPIFLCGGKRQAFNPAHVDCISEIDASESEGRRV